MIGGGALALIGLSRRSKSGFAIAAAGVLSGAAPFGFLLGSLNRGVLSVDVALNALEEKGLIRSLAAAFSIFVLFLGYLWIAWDPEKQGWHDKIAGTVVLKLPKGIPLL